MNVLKLGFMLLIVSAFNISTGDANGLRNLGVDDDATPVPTAPVPARIPATTAPVKADVRVTVAPGTAPVRASRNPSRSSKKPVSQAPSESTPIAKPTHKPASATTSAPEAITAVPTTHQNPSVVTDSPVTDSPVTMNPTMVATVTNAPSMSKPVNAPVAPVSDTISPVPSIGTPVPSTLAPIPSTIAPIPTTIAPIPTTRPPMAAEVTKPPSVEVKPVGGDDNEYVHVEPTTDDGNIDSPYVSPNDDPIKNNPDEEEWIVKPGETPDQLVHDSNFVIAIGSTLGIMLLLMVCTAQQVMDNPDGLCAR